MRHGSPETARPAWDAARDATAVQTVRSWTAGGALRGSSA